MPVIRPLAWPSDRSALEALDTGFRVERMLRLDYTADGVALREVEVETPYTKVYDLASDLERVAGMAGVLVAEVDRRVVGLAALRLEAWNRRAVVEYLLVAPDHRGRGLGRALVEAVAAEAEGRQARCLWVETQNLNVDAVRFYQRLGFRWCGFDDSLYDPAVVPGDEIALFFALGFAPHRGSA